jgi:signal peptidase I
MTVQRWAAAGTGGIVRWPVWRVVVAERSMEPALLPGDRLLVWRGLGPRRLRAVDAAGPGRRIGVTAGQVVVARDPQQPELLVVKRAAWREAGGWWVTADNPGAGGVDSFRFGPVPLNLIEGRVLGRYWPVWRRG